MQSHRPDAVDLVLVGGGHAHVHVLKMLGMMKRRPGRKPPSLLDGVRITLVAKEITTPYSGMLPGYVSGRYPYERIHLDLNRLCRWSGIRFVRASAYKITYDNNNNNNRGGGGGWVYCTAPASEEGQQGGGGERLPPIRYDCLSINVGIAPSPVPTTSASSSYSSSSSTGATTNGTASVIPVKPISKFCSYFDDLLSKVGNRISNTNSVRTGNGDGGNTPPYTICVVGGGAGGVELALSVQHRLSRSFPPPPSKQRQSPPLLSATSQGRNEEENQSFLRPNRSGTGTIAKENGNNGRVRVVLVTRGPTILEGHSRRVQRIVTRILTQRSIRVRCDSTVVDVRDDDRGRRKRLGLLGGDEITCDDVLWCISAGAPSWLEANTPFACTEDGFVRVSNAYECLYHPGVFCAGDCCHMDETPRPKAGVFAVRAGPYLVDNLVRYIHGRSLRKHYPQKSFLSILATGDEYAVASKGNWLAIEGKWVWTVKDRIDRTWMAQYSTDLPDLEEMMKQPSTSGSDCTRCWLPPFINPNNRRTQRFGLLASKGSDVRDAFFNADPMRCGGCGAKVGSTVVARVLREVHRRQVTRAIARNQPSPPPIDHDDAAIVPLPQNGGIGAVIHTIDYFREIVTDPYVFGKIVAVHALSDVHAMGVEATSALVLAVVPFCADEAMTEATLVQLLSGVSDVLQDEGVQLAGGHTCESAELACGLSVQGLVQREAPHQGHSLLGGYISSPRKQHRSNISELPRLSLLRKRGGRAGDRIVLTKPLGTGALFAADMRARAMGEHVREAIVSMARSNVHACRVAARYASERPGSIRACTDVTGFGLVGHLLEMLMANESSESSADHVDNDNSKGKSLQSISAVLDLRSIPFLRGGVQASSDGIFSTLHSSNARNRRAVLNHVEASSSAFAAEYRLLYDPQTAGGLLFFVEDGSACDDFVRHLRSNGDADAAAIIGRVAQYPEPTGHPVAAAKNARGAARSSSYGDYYDDGKGEGICAIGSCCGATTAASGSSATTGGRIRISW